MASSAKQLTSRFRESTSNDSCHRRRNLSNHLTPLEVDKHSPTNSWDGKAEQQIIPDSGHGAAKMVGGRRKARRSPRSELMITKRLEELAQLESPVLRDLAHRLATMLKIDTPRCAKNFDKHPYADLPVRQRWEEYQGCKGWEGLLGPDFDPVLKAEILRYGEFAQATYDAFDSDTNSLHFGTCKYTKSDLLQKVGLENRGYEITNFLYATTDVNFAAGWSKNSKQIHGNITQHDDERNGGGTRSEESKHDKIVGRQDCEECNESNINRHLSGPGKSCKNCSENTKQCNWIGFVAVCTSIQEIARLGRRDIVIAWRGSKTTFDWVANCMDYMSPAAFVPHGTASSKVRVEAGFMHLYTSTNARSRYCKELSVQEQVMDAIKKLVSKYSHEGRLSITLTGHSLGSALATLCAFNIAVWQLDLPQGDRSVSSDWRSPESQGEDAGASCLFPLCMSLNCNCRKGARAVLKKSYAFPVNRKGEPVNIFRSQGVPVTVFSFGGPKVGNRHFVNTMNELGVAVLRVVNKRDMVTKLPGLTIHRQWKTLKRVMPDMGSYRHVGVKLKLDNELSDYLQKPAGLTSAHCLEAYLHLVDSYQGINKDYINKWDCIWSPRGCINSVKSSIRDPTYKDKEKTRVSKYNEYRKTFRDHALVNKHNDFLKPEWQIPPRWWQEKKKGLVQNADGEWGLPDRDETIPGTEEHEKKELERSIRAAWERSWRTQHDRRRVQRASFLSRRLTMH